MTPFSAPTMAYQGSENDVMNWNNPSRNNSPPVYAIR